MQTFINMTPHVITICNEEGEVVANFPPSGQVARVVTANYEIVEIDGFKVYKQVVGEATGLPALSVAGVKYIVSMAVRTALPARYDLCSPGELIRDDAGQPVGCKGLIINWPDA